MTMLIAGIVIFLGIHSISIVAAPTRDALVTKLGLGPWKGLYSIISLVGFALICMGYGNARLDPLVLYQPPGWARHITMLLMLPVFVLFLAANLPGKIKSVVRDPLLMATKTWALAHLIANGTAADAILFGGFLLWAVVDLISVKQRRAREVPALPPVRANDMIAVVGGLGIYTLFVFWAHGALIGIPLFISS
ncbi:MAG: NnrU family protein [Pseudomonadota bacterium]